MFEDKTMNLDSMFALNNLLILIFYNVIFFFQKNLSY